MCICIYIFPARSERINFTRRFPIADIFIGTTHEVFSAISSWLRRYLRIYVYFKFKKKRLTAYPVVSQIGPKVLARPTSTFYRLARVPRPRLVIPSGGIVEKETIVDFFRSENGWVRKVNLRPGLLTIYQVRNVF